MKKIIALFTAMAFALTLGVAFAEEAAAPAAPATAAPEKAPVKKAKKEKKAKKVKKAKKEAAKKKEEAAPAGKQYPYTAISLYSAGKNVILDERFEAGGIPPAFFYSHFHVSRTFPSGI